MGTRADFYVGRGLNAEWIGSIAWDGFPDDMPKKIMWAKTESKFREAVKSFLNTREDATFPEDGWPWPWATSQTTDFSYVLDEGKIHVFCFGKLQAVNPKGHYDDAESTKSLFPDMADFKQREKLGPHSGVLVLGVKG